MLKVQPCPSFKDQPVNSNGLDGEKMKSVWAFVLLKFKPI